MAQDFRLDVEIAVAESNIDMLSGSSITFTSASYITGQSGSVVNFYSPLLMPVASASALPPPNAGTGSIYVKGTDNKLYFQNYTTGAFTTTLLLNPNGAVEDSKGDVRSIPQLTKTHNTL